VGSSNSYTRDRSRPHPGLPAPDGRKRRYLAIDRRFDLSPKSTHLGRSLRSSRRAALCSERTYDVHLYPEQTANSAFCGWGSVNGRQGRARHLCREDEVAVTAEWRCTSNANMARFTAAIPSWDRRCSATLARPSLSLRTTDTTIMIRMPEIADAQIAPLQGQANSLFAAPS
jgi:hypothetical protein